MMVDLPGSISDSLSTTVIIGSGMESWILHKDEAISCKLCRFTYEVETKLLY